MRVGQSYQVLLVEDEDIISMLTEAMLSDLGYTVAASVANLKDGLQAAANGNFDVAVLDINLHGVSSYPIADILIERAIPFIFASGYAARGIEPRYSKVLVVQKPFTIETLAKAIRCSVRSNIDKQHQLPQ